eukprot:gene6823-7537_t
MSTSVVLEGEVIISEEKNSSWKGVWRFAKDKKGTLAFEYEKIGHEVPVDLLEYVSFLDPASVAHSLNSKNEQTTKNKKGRRGRPPIFSSSTKPVSAVGGEGGMEGMGGGDDRVVVGGGAEEMAVMDDSLDDSQAMLSSSLLGVEEAGEGNEDRGTENATPPPIAANTTTSSSSSSQQQEQQQPAVIPSAHPLLGLWKGHFAVSSAKGEEIVEETLFFYSVLGEELLPQFRDLPPEPSFPFCLLKHHHLLNPTQAAAAAVAQVTVENPEDAPSSMLEHLTKNVLVGFGRNAIGRFSVAALYDEQQHELRCEKKYMSTKYAIKRGRRSHAEYALSYGYSPATGLAAPAPGMTTRQASDAGGVVTNPTEEGSASTSRASRNLYINTAGKHSGSLDGAAAAAAAVTVGDESLPSGKRKRSNSVRPDYITTFSHNNTAKTSKADLARYYNEQYADHPMALVGSRNPDNDEAAAPGAEGYREAFLDVDSGEIYEGQWSHGVRHGFGLCLYCHGLLYEGQWLRGREHGKGTLMTADRQIIYTGDWVDGNMHGSGEYHYNNGDIYIGDFKENNRHGRGEYVVYSSGARYVGEWKENRRHGKGHFLWSDGSYYEGDWEADKRHGRGLLELSNGFKYDGNWVGNVMEGKGTCTYAPSGQTYQGTFKAGLRDGRGSILFPQGSALYEGRFKEDRFDGQGTIKITAVSGGTVEDETFIPIQIQSDFWRIHWKAGFGANAH